MAPIGEASSAVAAVAPFLETIIGNLGNGDKRQRTPSWHELRSHADNHQEVELLSSNGDPSASVAEVEDAECESCGMSEECTPAYISAVRRRFSGRWVCGLCAEAVAEEAGKSGGGLEAALAAHMGVCKRFNSFGRTHPALFQADAMRDILRKLSGLGSPRSPKSSTSARDGAKPAPPAPVA